MTRGNRRNVLAEQADVITQLAKTRERVRYADFRDDLLEEAQLLREHLQELMNTDIIYYYKGLSTSSEIFYYFARVSDARDVIAQEGAKVLAEMPTWIKPATEKERALLKAKLWAVVHYTQVQYRTRLYTEARDNAEACMRTVQHLLVDVDHPMYGTRSRLCFVLGQTYRQLQQYTRSRACFLDALDFSYNRLAFKKITLDAKRFQQEQLAISRGIALASALGIGWLDLVSGRLQQARPLIALGRSLLFPTNDWVNKAYVDLLYGSLQRLMAGYDSEKLQAAMTILQHPYEAFARHLPYRARAAHQLALALFYSGEYEKAMYYVDQVRTISDGIGDAWWYCNALITQSRIERKTHKLEEAIRSAETALNKAREAKELLAEVDALIASGEAHLELEEYKVAKELFATARARGAENAQVRAVCHLHLASTFLRENNLRDAEEHLNCWSQLKDQIENAVVQAQGNRVETEFKIRMNDFVVPRAEPHLNFEVHVKRLREFLIDEARRRCGRNTENVAKELGVTRQTLYNWLAK
jgi:tetratricopeptide (TPR) repeat protein